MPSAVRSWREGLAEPKRGRPEEWFALDADDVPSASLPLEIKDEIGAWRGIAHDDLKRQHEDFVGVTKAANGKLSLGSCLSYDTDCRIKSCSA